MQELLNQIMPLLVTCLVGVLVVVVKSIGDVSKKLIEAKVAEVIAKIGKVEYEKRISTAMDIWGIVEEHFRLSGIIEETMSEKAALFNDLLLERIPSLDQADIDYLRQTIAGQVNSAKDAILPTIPKEG